VIHVTRLNGLPVVINAELIKFVEATPDTLISLTTGEKIMVKEPVEVVAGLATRYRHQVEAPTEGVLTSASAATPRGRHPDEVGVDTG
jgi:flagellar protein FlbD